jgi:predicted GTPase
MKIMAEIVAVGVAERISHPNQDLSCTHPTKAERRSNNVLSAFLRMLGCNAAVSTNSAPPLIYKRLNSFTHSQRSSTTPTNFYNAHTHSLTTTHHMQDLREVRVVVVGPTGAGKSSLASVLCPSTQFPISSFAIAKTDKATIGHQDWPAYDLRLVVCDTMGLNDTEHSDDVVHERVTEGVRALIGGVDFFLLIMKHGHRFTRQDYLSFKYAHTSTPKSCCR